MSTFKSIEQIILDQTTLVENIKKTAIKHNSALKEFLVKKKKNKEWIRLSSLANGPSEFYITDHGVYEILNKKIIALALFNQADLENYRNNNGMLDGLEQLFQQRSSSGCIEIIRSFLNRKL